MFSLAEKEDGNPTSAQRADRRTAAVAVGNP